jgi:hypothetical protein
MKWIFYLPVITVFLCAGCGFQEREAALQKRETELTRKEQELVVKEKNLQLKEDELFNREQELKKTPQPDTLASATASVLNPALVGAWTARMVCTETTCTGSAVGDTKTETWELSYQNGHVKAKATIGENLTRIYTGTYQNNLLELTENVEITAAAPATKMVVRLTVSDPVTMEGQREIIRSGDCRIVYALQLNKQ